MEKLFNKLKGQAALIAAIPLLYATIVLKDAPLVFTPATLTGYIAFAIGITLIVGQFFLHNVSESYQLAIKVLESLIRTLKRHQEYSDERIKNLSSTPDSAKSGTLEKLGYEEVSSGNTITGGTKDS